MNLTHQDIQEILRLLDDTPYDELKLQTANFRLALKRSPGSGGWTQETRTFGLDEAPRGAVPAETAATPEIAATEEGLLEIRTPMAGTFYRAPKPGAEPFVEVGSRVEEDTVIAIIEVMKLMSSIPAGYRGEVVEILAEDAGYVEKGQLLIRLRPDGNK